MDTRKNVTVTLEKAREWFNRGNATLREVALQAFTKEELTIPDWENTKTFEAACKAANISDIHLSLCFTGKGGGEYEHLVAINKADIICKALNGDWKPSLVSGSVYYPWVKFFPANKVPDNHKKDITDYFMYDGVEYALVGGGSGGYGCGLGGYYGGGGNCIANTGLFGCKSREIALHMSKHFAKEIFLACYADKLNGEIEWLPY